MAGIDAARKPGDFMEIPGTAPTAIVGIARHAVLCGKKTAGMRSETPGDSDIAR